MKLSKDKEWVTIHWEEYEELLKAQEKIRVLTEDVGVDLDKFLSDYSYD